MIISGWRPGANSLIATKMVQQHTGMSLNESKYLIEDVLDGTPRKLPDDFVLREELESLNFIIE